MKCETTSSVKECALRARSTHGVHHAIVEVNIVIGVVLGEVLVARVVPLVVDAVIGLTLGLIAHVVIVVFVEAIFNRIFLYGRYTLYTSRRWTVNCVNCYRFVTVILHQINVENHSTNNWPNHRLSSFPDRSVLSPSSR